MTYFDQVHSHYQEHHDICRVALRAVSRQLAIPLPETRRLFVDAADIQVTAAFWAEVNALYPGRFCGVHYCQSCRKFSLTPVRHS